VTKTKQFEVSPAVSPVASISAYSPFSSKESTPAVCPTTLKPLLTPKSTEYPKGKANSRIENLAPVSGKRNRSPFADRNHSHDNRPDEDKPFKSRRTGITGNLFLKYR
jgi:hypothetical protein